MKTTFIKIDRSILNWRWYKDGNTFRVFLHFLLTANIKPTFFRDIYIDRGELLSSYDSVANTLKLSRQEVRTAFRHLKSTGEITIRRYSKFSVITVVNYEMYQSKQHKGQHNEQHSDNTQPTVCEHHIKNIRNKEYKEKYIGLGITDEKLLEALCEYEEMRCSKNKELTDNGRKRLLKKLDDITQNIPNQITLLETATDNHWLTVYSPNKEPIKKSNAGDEYVKLMNEIMRQNQED